MATAARQGRENSKTVCRFFGTAKGCWFGEQCRYLHDRSKPANIPICRFYTTGSCRFGKNCKFLHAGVSQPHLKAKNSRKDLNNNVPAKPKPKPIYLNDYKRGEDIKKRRRKIHPRNKDTLEDVYDRPSSLKQPEKSPTKDESKIKGKDHAGKKAGNTEICKQSDIKDNEEKPAEEKPTHVHCGNCDVKYENTDAGRESLADHHQEKLLSLDDTHTELFRHPGWGEEPCVCILCDCEVGSPVEFLQHLKSNLEEEVPENRTKHKDILKSIIEDLIEADEEGDSDAFLIENIKDWFGLETDYGWPFFFGIDGCESGDDETDQSASESDGDDDKLRFIMNRLGLYQEDSDDDSDEGMFGMSSDEVNELLCQGIKPWDPEAFAALEVLYDY